MRRQSSIVFSLALVAVVMSAKSQAAEPEKTERQDDDFTEQVAASAETLELYLDSEKLEMLKAYKWANTARRPLGDRLCLLYLHNGRPVASCKIYPTFRDIVFTPISMTDQSIFAVLSQQTVWSPTASPTEHQRLKAVPVPSDSKARRRVEMKAIARKFTATTGEGEARRQRATTELRLLPTPLHQYSSDKLLEETKILDGAVFAFVVQGGNPQVLMMIEAVADESGNPAYWQVGFSRRTFAKLSVDFKDQQIWSVAALPGRQMNSKSYFHKIVVSMSEDAN